MAQYRVAGRYAEALLQLAENEKAERAVTSDLLTLGEAVKASREFAALIRSPIIRPEKKESVFAALFAKKFHRITINFFRLLLEKQREKILLDVIERFLELSDDRKGIAAVEVKSAVELSQEMREKVTSYFETVTGKKIRLQAGTDSTLVGGILAKVGDTIYDASVRNQLERLRRQLTEAHSH